MAWPVVVAMGGPRERGRTYGHAARDRVHHSIELYQAIFAHYTGLAWEQVRARAGAFVEPIDALDVQLLPELEGIAEGAGVDAEDILALNVRTEVMYGLGAPGAAAAECTAVGLAGTRSAEGHVLVAENWDWKPRARDTCVLLVMAPHGRPGFLTLVEAGLLAKSGMNEAGIGQVVNALVSSRDRGQAGAPFHAILRRTLTSGSLEEAVDAVRRPHRASSANYLLGSAGDGIADVEAAPGGPDMVTVTTGDLLVHANHFLRPNRPFKDLSLLDGQDSPDRQRSVHEALGAASALEIGDVIEALRRHADPDGGDGSVCAHGDPSLAREADYVTIATIAMDLTAGTLDLSEGNPCAAAVERFAPHDLLQAARSTAVETLPG
jgi:isopenicillin-N N-acyltransferase-like protein